MTLPLYSSAAAAPPKYNSNSHAGLWFDKFCDQWANDGQSWSMSHKKGSRPSSDPKLDWINTLTGRAIGDKGRIEEYVARLTRLVEARKGTYTVFTTESRFVTGLGRSHPVENGFAWHPTLGTPYLPGSSIKGLVRAWAKTETGSAGATPDGKTVDRLLGSSDGSGSAGSVGSVCCLDAVPVKPVKLEADVMTPHYAGWSPSDPPGDWLSPTPIPFLVTAPETSFLFGIIPRTTDDGADPKQVEHWLREALEWFGAGAKTAVGYGRFARDDTSTDHFGNQLAELERQRKERRREELEALAREQRLASLSPIEQEIEGILDSQQDPGMTPTTAIFKAIEKARWSGADKIEAARWLQNKMEKEGRWKKTTKKKQPKRDKDHTRTLQVMAWLNGE